jgi:hypothetical protein
MCSPSSLLAGELEECTKALLAMPPAYSVPGGPSAEYAELMRAVAAKQALLTQFCEEKVCLKWQRKRCCGVWVWVGCENLTVCVGGGTSYWDATGVCVGVQRSPVIC